MLSHHFFFNDPPQFDVTRLSDHDAICRYCLPPVVTNVSDYQAESKYMFDSLGVVASERALNTHAHSCSDKNFYVNLPLFDSVYRFPIEEIFSYQSLIADLTVKHTTVAGSIRVDIKHSNMLLCCGVFAQNVESAITLLEETLSDPKGCGWRARKLVCCTIANLKLQYYIKSAGAPLTTISPVFDLSRPLERFRATVYALKLGAMFAMACTKSVFELLYSSSCDIVLSPSSFEDLLVEYSSEANVPTSDMEVSTDALFSGILDGFSEQVTEPESDQSSQPSSPSPSFYLFKRITRSSFRNYPKKPPCLKNNKYAVARKAWKLIEKHQEELYGEKVFVCTSTRSWFEIFIKEPVTRFEWSQCLTRTDAVASFIDLMIKIMRTLNILHKEFYVHTEVLMEHVYVGTYSKRIYFLGLDAAMRVGTVPQFPREHFTKNFATQPINDIQQAVKLFDTEPYFMHAMGSACMLLKRATRSNIKIYEQAIGALEHHKLMLL